MAYALGSFLTQREMSTVRWHGAKGTAASPEYVSGAQGGMLPSPGPPFLRAGMLPLPGSATALLPCPARGAAAHARSPGTHSPDLGAGSDVCDVHDLTKPSEPSERHCPHPKKRR